MIQMTVVGAEQAADYFEQVADNAGDLTPAMDAGIRELEIGHRIKFGRMGGRYVETGRFMASLTSDSADAIRRTSANGLDFGTSVPYARFLPPILIREGKPFSLIAEGVAGHLVRSRYGGR
jgi:hypothetical protein